MQKTTSESVQELPLSHTIYCDDEIDVNKAQRLIVYHYPLTKSYKWKEWQDNIDNELGNRYFPYLMRGYKEQYGLFVAVDSPEDQPPVITNGDGVQVLPERVQYAPELNPVWIRLIMRKTAAFDSHCQGRHSLGRPLLKVDVWNTKKSMGINAVSLDCRTQQLRDKKTTEVVLLHDNVPLRPLRHDKDPASSREPLWVYDKNKVMVRWTPNPGDSRPGVVYKEIKKKNNKRKQRAFIDLSNPQAFQGSWPCILQPVQDAFIEKAAQYGFKLRAKILHLQRLPLKTKYKSNTSKTVFPSISLDTKVEVVDLRVSKTIPTADIVARLQQAADSKSLGVEFCPLVEADAEDVDSLNFESTQRVLVLIDQRKGLVADRYRLTKSLRTKVACQHINVNPHDLQFDSLEQGLLVEQTDEQGNPYLIPQADSPYFEYGLEQFDHGTVKAELQRNTEIVVKELVLKHLLLCEHAAISTSLPEQKEVFSEQLVVVTDGYVFTTKNDKPVLVPFTPSVSEHAKTCDAILAGFNTSIASLLQLLKDKWPYNYRPSALQQGYGSYAEKRARFIRKLTIVIHEKNGEVSILFQDPKYEIPHMLPQGLAETYDRLGKQYGEYPLSHWYLPDESKLRKIIEELYEKGGLSSVEANTLSRELDKLRTSWMESLEELDLTGEHAIDYDHIKKLALKRFRNEKNRLLAENEKKLKRVNSRVIAAWDTVMSYLTDLPLNNTRRWLRRIPGIQRLWYDREQNYFIVGPLAAPKDQIMRQPSIRQWHALQGELDVALITSLVDVDWVRMNQLAGNPCVATLVKRWRECRQHEDEALNAHGI